MAKNLKKEKSLSYIIFLFPPPPHRNNNIKKLKVMTLVKGQTKKWQRVKKSGKHTTKWKKN